MYNKLFTKILDSSIWLEPSPTRIVWMTFLASMDEDGFVELASVANVAHRAIVSLEDAKKAVECLESPDENSANPDNDGKRIERVDGGWIVLNAPIYRNLASREKKKEDDRNRQRIKRCRNVSQCVANSRPSESESESESEDKNTPIVPFSDNVALAPCKQDFFQFKTEHDIYLAKSICDIFKRRYSTPWSTSELKAFKQIGEFGQSDIDAIRWLHEIQHPYRRRKIQQLCNNFYEEVEKSNQYKKEKNYGIPKN